MSEENLFPKAQILIDKKEYDFGSKAIDKKLKTPCLNLKI